MLLESHRLEIFNSACNPGAMAVHCFAHLDQDVGEALPYLNTVLGGFEYIQDPPSVTFKAQGKLITVHGRKITINALKDQAEAHKIVRWLQREINAAWENRERIVPSCQGAPRPQLLEVLKLLPKTNCAPAMPSEVDGESARPVRQARRKGLEVIGAVFSPCRRLVSTYPAAALPAWR